MLLTCPSYPLLSHLALDSAWPYLFRHSKTGRKSFSFRVARRHEERCFYPSHLWWWKRSHAHLIHAFEGIYGQDSFWLGSSQNHIAHVYWMLRQTAEMEILLKCIFVTFSWHIFKFKKQPLFWLGKIFSPLFEQNDILCETFYFAITLEKSPSHVMFENMGFFLVEIS